MRQIFSPLDGFRSPFGRLMGSTAPFTPAVLFGASEPGVWYDPSDLTTLFQDTAGTTPVTTPGQTVALALDKSKELVLGPELVTNGTFDSGVTSWTGVNATLSQSSGACVITADGLGQARASQTISTVAGRWYEARATLARGTGTVNVDLLITGITNSASVSSTTPTDVVVRFAATGATTTIRAGSSGTTAAGTTYIVDNISVKELPGFHATQATAASRPTYGIVPRTGRRNLLTRTEEFENGDWLKLNAGTGSVPTVTANAGASPIGTTTADRVVFNRGAGTTSSDVSRLFQSGTTLASGVGVLSIWMRSFDGSSSFTIGLNNGIASSTVTVTGSWQRFSLTSGGTTVNAQIRLQGDITQQNADILIWGAQLETGSTATAYQRVGSAFDVTEAGVASLSYLSFDGVDDSLVTPTVSFSTDKMTVFAGVRKLSDAATGMLVESSVDLVNNAGTFYLTAPQNNTAVYGSQSRGNATNTSTQRSESAAFAAPHTAVLSATHDIAGDLTALRVNGGSAVNATGDKGTGNFLAYPLYIGRRAGASLPLNGQLFSLIVRNAATDAATITSSETWVAGKTGVTL